MNCDHCGVSCAFHDESASCASCKNGCTKRLSLPILDVARMNIYLLQRPSTGYDQARGFVVSAKSEGFARLLVAGQAGDEGADEWLLEATCNVIGMSNSAEERVVLRDYKAG